MSNFIFFPHVLSLTNTPPMGISPSYNPQSLQGKHFPTQHQMLVIVAPLEGHDPFSNPKKKWG